ncbi:MAG: PEP-CTERM sorting domain-containing protein [Luteolibacter sp.]
MKNLAKPYLLLAASAALSVQSATASFHTWNISEIFSNADGSVQFIELVNGGSNGQDQFNGKTITSSASTNTYTFLSNLSVGSATANLRLVIATPSFQALSGIQPDYADLPPNFFDPAGDTINFGGVDSVTFTGLPTNGIDSFNYTGGNNGPGQNIATNSPTNLAGEVGQVPEPSPLLLLSIAGVVALTGRRRA